MIVNLTPPDIKKCREAAIRRIEERIRNSPKYTQADFKRLYKTHYPGAVGEWAVCKAYGCKWTGEYFGDGGLPWSARDLDANKWDVEVGEVRTTAQPHRYGGMRLYPSDDRPEAPSIWVNLHFKGTLFAKVTLVGWYDQGAGRKAEWWHPEIGENGAWVVPKDNLKNMDTLPTQI